MTVGTPRRRIVMGLMLFCAAWLAAPTVHAQGGQRARVHAALNHTALQAGQQATLAVVLDVQPGYHAQSNKPYDENYIKTEVTLADSAAVMKFEPVYPPGRDEMYPALGRLSVYSGRTIIYVPVQVKPDAPAGPLQLKGSITYQICNDKACFAPETTEFTVDTTVVPAGTATQPNEPGLFAGFDPSVFSNLAGSSAAAAPAAGPRVEIFGKDLDKSSWAFLFFAAFVIGTIFNIVPCVLPVVPLKAIGFYEVSQHNRAKSFLLGLVFSLGIVIVFAVLGLLVVVLRKLQWGELYSNPWFLGALVVILAALALQLFGVFNVFLPQSVYRFTPRHDTYTGNLLFGILAAVLSTPCTFGMFLGLMIWATRQPAAIGMALMITVGIGMAAPYLVLSALPNLARSLPRSGPWSELVKQMMGFLLLVSAVYFARRFIEAGVGDRVFWWTLFAVVMAAGVFLVLRTASFAKRGVGIAVATMIAILFVAPSFWFVWRITHPPIDWKPYTEASFADARKTSRPVMLEFTAAWCANCITVETTVFHDKQAVAAIKRHDVIPLRADLTKKDAPGWKLLREISPVGAIPLTAVYPPKGDQPLQLSGIYDTSDLVTTLDAAAQGKLVVDSR